MSAPPAPDLSQQLASLRLSRDEAPRPSGGGWLKVALICGVALAVVGGLAYGFRDRLDVKTVDAVLVQLVQAGQEAPLFVATGTVTAPVTATLAPRTPGRLLRLLVQEGDEVALDQPVALLDPTDLKLAVMQARADVASAQAKLEAAQAALPPTRSTRSAPTSCSRAAPAPRARRRTRRWISTRRGPRCRWPRPISGCRAPGWRPPRRTSTTPL